MTLKLNTDNGLQGRTTERLLVTAVWRNGGFRASYDSFVVGSSAVLRLNFVLKSATTPTRKTLALTLKDDTTDNKQTETKDKKPTLRKIKRGVLPTHLPTQKHHI
ncbi:MAG: hypothetical protein IPO86_16035 [Saprospiraceae bacterium]|nr:hypothetical protein [Saprospiraceae bacterium]